MNSKRPRVLLLAESANPDWSSVSLIGWSLSRALADHADVHLVTHARNREAIERMGWREGREFSTVNSDAVGGPVNKFGAAVQKATGLGWTFTTALSILPYFWFEQLIWSRFGERIRAREFDVVHRITPVSPAVPSPIAKRCHDAGVPFVWGPINGGVPWPKEFRSALRSEGEWLSYLRDFHKLMPAYAATRRSAAATLAGSKYVWNELAGYQDRAVYLPENAVEPDRFAVDRKVEPAPPLRVAFVGRLVALKGVDMLIEAAAPLMASGRIALDIIGDGPERGALEALADAKGVRSALSIAGWLEHRDVAARLGRAHVLGFPSVRDFGGGVVLEAMAMGIPALVVDYGGPSELVTDATGWRVPIGSRDQVVAGLRAQLGALVADPSRIDEVGRRARERVFRHYTWDVKARQLLEVYAWVRGARGRPDFGMPFPDAPAELRQGVG